MKILNVLYQSNDYYAAVTGISMVSLMKNNRDIDEINFFLLNDNISEVNLSKLQFICDENKRNLIIVETKKILKKLRDELRVAPFKNTYTTYFKLLAVKSLYIPTDRVLQLDGDTIITGSLAPLLDFDFDGNIMAATYNCGSHNSYKKMIDIPLADKYYNCGVILFNQPLWIEQNCEEQIISHIKNVRNRYFTVDQDILNILFRHKTKYLDITYNFSSGFYVFGIKDSLYIYDLNEEYFDSYEIIKDAYDSPIIHHCLGAMTGKPWEKGNWHPQEALFDYYLERSPWKGYEKLKVNRGFIFKIQKVLYKFLPRRIYVIIHRYILIRYLEKMNREIQK